VTRAASMPFHTQLQPLTTQTHTPVAKLQFWLALQHVFCEGLPGLGHTLLTAQHTDPYRHSSTNPAGNVWQQVLPHTSFLGTGQHNDIPLADIKQLPADGSQQASVGFAARTLFVVGKHIPATGDRQQRWLLTHDDPSAQQLPSPSQITRPFSQHAACVVTVVPDTVVVR
jgi:hypothetical protein